jgi:hypothetical protein
LAEADALIDARRYNEATVLLVEYARKYPKDFEGAQIRNRRIMRFREEYNRVAQQLLDTVEKDPGNADLILTLTNRLIELDPQRIAETQDFINRTREVALFRSNLMRLETILVRAQEQIERGGYAQALRIYAGGLDIYQAELFSAGFGAATENRGRQGIAALNAGVNDFASVQNPLENALAALESMSGQSFDQNALTSYRNAYNRFTSELERLMVIRNSFLETQRNFGEDLERIRGANPGIATRNFFAFAVVLLEGRSENTADGFLGILDNLWNRSAERAAAAMRMKNEGFYAALAGDGRQKQYALLEDRAGILAAYAAFPLDLIERRTRFGAAAGENTSELLGQRVTDSRAADLLGYRSLVSSSAYLRTVGNIGARYADFTDVDTLAALRGGGSAEVLMRQERSVTTSLRALGEGAGRLGGEIRGDITQYRGLDSRYPGSPALNYLGEVQEIADQLAASITAMESNSSARYYTMANAIAGDRLKTREEAFARGSEFMEGQVLADGFVSRHPSEALTVLGEITSVIDGDIQSMQNLINEYNAEPEGVISSGQVGPLHADALAAQTRFTQIRSQARAMETAARSRAAEAQNRRLDGDRLLNEARAALAQGNYEAARTRLLSASSSYDMSLDLEDNPQLRTERDSNLRDLDTAIAAAVYQAVLEEVKTLVEQAEQDYWNSGFEQAEEKLLRAQNRWSLSQADEHPDIALWLGRVRNALAQRSTRNIPVTAPLYPEMSQLLSEAQKNYNEGLAFFNQNRNRDGEVKFNAARQDIQRVLLVYPANETAGLLNLRIDQRLDPNFNITFQQKVSAAIALTKRSNLQGLYDLLNLRVINPAYPGWDAIVYQAEIDTGRRPPPPDPADLARARELVEQARPLIQSGVPVNIETARGLLSEARRLDPGNSEAVRLYNEAGARTVSSSVMDSESERLYRQALAELTNNRPLMTLQLIEQIVARNPQYANNSRIRELRQRARSF